MPLPSVPVEAVSPYATMARPAGHDVITRRLLVGRVRGPFRLGFNPGSFDTFTLPEIPEELAKMAKEAKIDLRPGAVVLPSPIPLTTGKPGVNGIGTRDRGQTNEQALQQFEAVTARNKQIVIDPSEIVPAWARPPGFAPSGYAVEWPAVDAERRVEVTHFEEVWNVPVGTNSDDLTVWRFNRGLQGLWIASLLCRGLIRPADTGRVTDNRTRKVERLEESVRTAYDNPEAREFATGRRKARMEQANAPILGVEAAPKSAA